MGEKSSGSCASRLGDLRRLRFIQRNQIRGVTGDEFSRQQPSGVTPGVAAAPVVLAGAIMPGADRYIVTPSAHAEVFGVGITVVVGSMLVSAS